MLQAGIAFFATAAGTISYFPISSAASSTFAFTNSTEAA